MKNGIVIPCFNDETNLNLTEIEKFIKCNSKTVLCFVNNASNDETLTMLKKFQLELLNSHHSLATQLLILNLESKENLSEAIKSGIHHLLVNTLVKNISVAGLLFKQKSIAFSMSKQTRMINAA